MTSHPNFSAFKFLFLISRSFHIFKLIFLLALLFCVPPLYLWNFYYSTHIYIYIYIYIYAIYTREFCDTICVLTFAQSLLTSVGGHRLAQN
jgi:hypothetical protein